MIRWPTRVVQGLIRAYQLFVSPLLGPRCRFHPSCLHYAQEAIAVYGLRPGGWLALRRPLRCHPWHPGGFDPRPPPQSVATAAREQAESDRERPGGRDRDGDWPEGLRPIKWNRDTCVRCNMVISDRCFAAEMCGGTKDTVFKVDDIGCLIFWLRDKAGQFPWMAEAATRLWVADCVTKGERCFEPCTAHFPGGRISPMGYNFVAIGAAREGSADFSVVRRHMLARGK